LTNTFTEVAGGSLPGQSGFGLGKFTQEFEQISELEGQISQYPDKACSKYVKMADKMQAKVEKYTGKVKMTVTFDSNRRCLPSGGLTGKVTKPICDLYNKNLEKLETKVSKSAVVIFKDGTCTSGYEILKKNLTGIVTDKVKQVTGDHEQMVNRYRNASAYACDSYNEIFQKFNSSVTKINGFITDSVTNMEIWNKLAEFQPQIFQKDLIQEMTGSVHFSSDQKKDGVCVAQPGQGFKALTNRITGSRRRKSLSAKSLSVSGVCQVVSENVAKLQEMASQNGDIEFDDAGKCRQLSFFEWIINKIIEFFINLFGGEDDESSDTKTTGNVTTSKLR